MMTTSDTEYFCDLYMKANPSSYQPHNQPLPTLRTAS